MKRDFSDATLQLTVRPNKMGIFAAAARSIIVEKFGFEETQEGFRISPRNPYFIADDTSGGNLSVNCIDFQGSKIVIECSDSWRDEHKVTLEDYELIEKQDAPEFVKRSIEHFIPAIMAYVGEAASYRSMSKDKNHRHKGIENVQAIDGPQGFRIFETAPR